jgi:hypothetical protein
MKNHYKPVKNLIIFVLFIGLTFSRAERSITDFRVPPSSALDVDIAGGLSGGDRQFRFYNHQFLRGNFELDMEGFTENDNKDLYSDLSFSLDPCFRKENFKNDTTLNHFELYTFLGENLRSLSYINASDFFGSLSGTGEIWWSYTRYNDINYNHDIFGDFSAGFEFGYGRLRDGTNLWKALEIERILKAEDVITDDLPSEDILVIAQTVNQMQKFQINHDRSEKYFYGELENQFQALGIDRIPAYVWFKVKEIIDCEIVPRRFGYRAAVGPYVSGNGQYFYDQTDSIKSNIGHGESSIFGRFSLSSAYPITSRLQYGQDGHFDLNEKGIDTGISVYLDYRVSLHIALDLTNSFGYTSPRFNMGEKNINHSHNLSFSYYLEDNMLFRCSVGYNRQWDADFGSFNHEISTGISFSYDVW